MKRLFFLVCCGTLMLAFNSASAIEIMYRFNSEVIAGSWSSSIRNYRGITGQSSFDGEAALVGWEPGRRVSEPYNGPFASGMHLFVDGADFDSPSPSAEHRRIEAEVFYTRGEQFISQIAFGHDVHAVSSAVYPDPYAWPIPLNDLPDAVSEMINHGSGPRISAVVDELNGPIPIPVPEPATLLLTGCGLVYYAFYRRRRRREI
jgi:hypothetical protein